MSNTQTYSKEKLHTYIKVLSMLLHENKSFDINHKIDLLRISITENNTANVDTNYNALKDTFWVSYFNGANNDEMKLFTEIKAGRFFSDSAFEIISAILGNKKPQDQILPILDQYIKDRQAFISAAKSSLKKLQDASLS